MSSIDNDIVQLNVFLTKQSDMYIIKVVTFILYMV